MAQFDLAEKLLKAALGLYGGPASFPVWRRRASGRVSTTC